MARTYAEYENDPGWEDELEDDYDRQEYLVELADRYGRRNEKVWDDEDYR